MEIMTKEEYFRTMLEKTLLRLEEIENAMNKMTHNTDDETASQMTNMFIGEALDIGAVDGDCRYADKELNHFVNAEFDEAYEAYVENNKPKLHQYVVSFEFPAVYGTVMVKAKDEDEAEEYVQGNLEVSDVDLYMYDKSDVLCDPEIDESCRYADIEVTDVEEDGEYDSECEEC